jgi:transposase
MLRAIDRLVLPTDQRSELQRWVVALGTPQQVALRCRIILAVAAGRTEMETATENGVNPKTVRLWRERFRGGGLQALWEIAPGRGRKPRYDASRVKAVIDATLQTKPKGSTHWSCRTMAVAQGIGKSSVSRIWRSHNIKPYRTETFKLSRDPKFLEKLTDVVGLYLNPPYQAIVLCVDGKSQIQALGTVGEPEENAVCKPLLLVVAKPLSGTRRAIKNSAFRHGCDGLRNMSFAPPLLHPTGESSGASFG